MKYLYGGWQRGPEGVVSVRFHPSVTKAEDRAFFDCRSLKNVVFNEGLVTIGSSAFDNCSLLTSITLPSTVIEIERNAFVGCTSLREVVLNEGLQKIERNAFGGCSLESITIPSSVVEIGEYGFDSCKNLRGIVCSGVLPKIGSSTFNECSALERITFPNISSRVDNIIQAGQVDVQNKIQQCINRGEIEWERGGTIHIPVDARSSTRPWKELKQRFDQIVAWIKYYELREATTFFELALWKAKIDQIGSISRHDRDACRVDVPGPVKDAIMQYL